VAAITGILDQALKLCLINVYDLEAKGVVPIAPMVDLVLTQNPGISYGLFQQETALGRWLLVAVSVLAIALLWVWLARAHSRLTAIALGLIIGGAIGNLVDRLAYGWVADFVLVYLETAYGRFNWYVFNLADAAIVVGAAGLLWQSLFPGSAAKAP
jgi:signal peptidase II